MDKFKRYFFFFITFCFCGYIWEVFYTYMRKGVVINMGTLKGPWLPIYGAGGLIIYFIYKKIKSNALGLFLISSISAAIIEYATSYYLEMVYHMKWWDYSKKPFNLNGRIWLYGVLFFGVFALICIKIIIPLLDKLYDKVEGKGMSIVLYTLLALFTIDFVCSTISPNTDDAKKVALAVVDFNSY